MPSPTATSFTVSELKISPSQVQVNESTTVSVLVTNTSIFSRTFNVDLKIDNVVVDTKAVKLDRGANEVVTSMSQGAQPVHIILQLELKAEH